MEHEDLRVPQDHRNEDLRVRQDHRNEDLRVPQDHRNEDLRVRQDHRNEDLRVPQDHRTQTTERPLSPQRGSGPSERFWTLREALDPQEAELLGGSDVIGVLEVSRGYCTARHSRWCHYSLMQQNLTEPHRIRQPLGPGASASGTQAG
ncbi:hypothetical protein EYF80_062914 [Liparis tanakae]|uniref:Uncharacterized protein n=1 Tax=Liparis tanakae TaxID=230148 RepID=A0A4Z2EEM4_9TELE|nr:hypothetical protein EYF80_062914 [Liparis tanakae]